jgi:hypothetical protein
MIVPILVLTSTTTPNSIITLKGEDLPQPRNGAPTTTDAYVSQLRSDPYAANLVLAVPGINTPPTGSDLVQNGTFDSNVNSWTITDTGTIVHQSDGTAKVTRGTSAEVAYQNITTVVGTTYELSVDITDIAGSHGQVYVYSTDYSGSLDTNIGYSFYTGTFKGTFTADTTTTRIALYAHPSGSTSYDNISVKATTIRDYSADIKGSGTNKTLAVNGDAGIRTINDTSGSAVGGYYGSAMTFDGTNDYFTTPNSSDFYFNGDFTVEAWIYRNVTNTAESIVGVFENSSARRSWMIETRSNSAIRFQWWSDGSSSSDITSANNSVPGSQWNHIAMVKNNDTITGYVNGVAVGIDTTAGSIYENTDDPLRIGILNAAEDQDFNGYLQDLRIYKGVAKYKGGFDVPKPYTPVGIATWRAVPDTTANNFATLNAVDRNSGTLTNGNLTFTDDGSDGWNNSRATIGVSTGKYYWEMRADAVVNAVLCASIAGPNGNDSTKGARLGFLPGQTDDAGVTYYASGYLYHADNQSGGSAWGDSYTNGDIISIAVDMNDSGGKVWFAKNGTWQVSGNPSTGANAARSDLKTYADTWFPISGTYYSISAQTFNFGQNPTFSGNTTAGTFTDSNSKGLFKYQPPSGFLALCEDNLPTPAISDPGKYFRTCALDW